ncbi:MAG: glycosyltransferase family 2 protein [Flavobacteriales bacterium]|nr:glycosyltransferase family 2 protein [Flavobacteriales bacterium]
MRKLSAVIITHNEARNIKRCIASLQDVADEIVVVDSFSTDATPSICKGMNVHFHQREWKGYSKQKNYGNGLASNDWILSIDADEALSEELKSAIVSEKEHGKDFNYSFNRLTNYCGKWIHHSGWYPDTKVRMFNRTKNDWQGEVHEKLTVEPASVKKLKGDLLHFSYHSVSDHVKRTDTYSTLGASELFENGKKASLIKLLFNPWLKFNKMYFIKLGFLDGMAGFTIALITAYGTFLKYIKLYYLTKNRA